MSLVQKHCIPCEGGTSPLSPRQVKEYLKEVPKWTVLDNKKLSREFKFSAEGGSASGGKNSSFILAMDFVNNVAKLAESENHHPDVHIFYNKVSLELSTHAIGGLSENDFILASEIDQIYR